MYKVIMVPTEGSDSEKAVIAVAAKLAQRFKADLRLVRVLSAPTGSETLPPRPVLEITEDAVREERLECGRSPYGISHSLPWTRTSRTSQSYPAAWLKHP